MYAHVRDFFRKVGTFAIEIYLVCTILLSLTEFLSNLPGEVDFFRKMLSWIILLHLLATISLTEIFFGTRSKGFDWLLLAAFYVLSLHSFFFYAGEEALMLEERPDYMTLKPLVALLTYIGDNLLMLSNLTKYIGFAALVLLSVVFAARFNFSEKSVLGVMHEEGPPARNLSKFLTRFILVFIVLNAFSVFVFNLLMEWLGWAVDAPLLVICLAYYVYMFLRQYFLTGRAFGFYDFLEHVGSVGESFAKNFIGMFHYKNTFYIGFIGLLVCHILTDIGTYIIPYMTGLDISLYSGAQLAEQHQPVFFADNSLFYRDAFMLDSWYERLVILLGYILNMTAVFLLMIMPAYFWYVQATNKTINFSKAFIVIFAVSATFLFLCPTFGIGTIGEGTEETGTRIMGVDIVTGSLLDVERSPTTAITIAIFIGGIVLLLYNRHKRPLSWTVIIASLAVFGIYIYNYFLGLYSYSIAEIVYLIRSELYIMAMIIFTYFMLTFVLYIVGYLIFLVDVVKERIE